MIIWDEYLDVEHLDALEQSKQNQRRMRKLMNLVYAVIRDNPLANSKRVRREAIRRAHARGIEIDVHDIYLTRAIHKLDRKGGIEHVIHGRTRVWVISAHNETEEWLRQIDDPNSPLMSEVTVIP
jgi:hypothetical protein